MELSLSTYYTYYNIIAMRCSDALRAPGGRGGAPRGPPATPCSAKPAALLLPLKCLLTPLPQALQHTRLLKIKNKSHLIITDSLVVPVFEEAPQASTAVGMWPPLLRVLPSGLGRASMRRMLPLNCAASLRSVHQGGGADASTASPGPRSYREVL